MKCCKEELAGACGGTCLCGQEAEQEESCCGGGCDPCVLDTEEFGQDSFPYSHALDAGKFVILSMLTMTAYHIYWMYRNWNHIKEYTKQPIRPAGRTVAALFPILDIVLFCLQFKTIHDLTKKDGHRSFSLPWVCIGNTILLIIGWALLIYSFLPQEDPTLIPMLFFIQAIAALLTTLVLLPVQMALNDFWLSQKPQKPLRTSYTNGEKAWMVVGGFFLLLSVLNIFFAQPAVSPFDYIQPGAQDTLSSLKQP